MRVLVTGNLGYIGPRLVGALGRDGHDVIGLDIGWFASLGGEPILPAPTQHAADIRDLTETADGRSRLLALLAGVDAVIHLAAVSNDPVADVHPAITHEVNFKASAELARRAREAGVRRFVMFSTCSVYGDADGEVDESTPPRILTPYADSKVRLEDELKSLHGPAFWPVLLRSATVFGYAPALRLDLMVNGMTAWALTTGVVRLISTGEALRPQVHIDDLVEVAAALIRRSDAAFAAIAARPINVGANANNHAIRDLAEMVAASVPGSSVRLDPEAWVDRRSYRVRFDLAAQLIPEAPIRRDVARSVPELAERYRAVGLSEAEVRDLRYTRLGQLRAAREYGILDDNLRLRPTQVPPVAPLP